MLPCLFYSPKANPTTKEVLPLDDADLATHLLRMCPARWQAQYDLSKNTTPLSTRALLVMLENIENNADLEQAYKPKQAKRGWREVQDGVYQLPDSKETQEGGLDQQALCPLQEAWGPFKSHNMCDCRHFNKDRMPIKNCGGASRPQPNKKGPKGANFVQLMRTDIKKTPRKPTRKDK